MGTIVIFVIFVSFSIKVEFGVITNVFNLIVFPTLDVLFFVQLWMFGTLVSFDHFSLIILELLFILKLKGKILNFL
jgi:hypothetical protein